MRRLLVTLFIFLLPIAASASVLGVQQGGTASSTLTGILFGNGVGSIKSLTIGTNLTLTGSTLNASGGGSSTFGTTSLSALWPILYTQSSSLAQFSWLGIATSSPFSPNQFVYTNNAGNLVTAASSSLSLPNTAFQNSSLTINGTAIALGSSGTITAASSTLLSDSNAFSGTLNTFTNAPKLGALSGIIYGNVGTLNTQASSSETCSSPLSCTGFDVLKNGGAITIAQATTGTNGYLSLTDFQTFNNKISSSSLTASYPLAYSSATGAFTWSGLSTSSPFSVDQLIYTNHSGSLVTVASSSLSLPNTALQNSSVTINTSAPLGGGGAVSLGNALTLTCTSCSTFAYPFVLATNFGASRVASTTGGGPIWFQNGVYASSTLIADAITDAGLKGSGFRCVDATSAGTLAILGADCGSVTSITAGTGLSGGSITTAGTVALLSYLATSSAETATRIPTWSSTNGTPATLTGGFSGYTINAAGTLATLTNASTTALTVGTYFQPPNATTNPANTAAGSIVLNTNGTASTSIAIGDGTNTNQIFATHSVSLVLASSTLAYYGSFGSAGTTTTVIANPLHGSVLRSFFCQTDTGTAWVGFTFGSGTETTEVQCTTAGASVSPASNNTGVGRQAVKVNVGRSASSPNLITITADVEDTN